jgi:hypothetical protein
MNRRNFFRAGLTTILLSPGCSVRAAAERAIKRAGKKELAADLVVAGGGLGGCAAAVAALRNGLRVILTEETDWIGGQLTSQGVPPDEHQWIETHGCTRSYRAVRDGIRQYYRERYPLNAAARATLHLNPGDGSVSRLCHEPRVALAVLNAMLAPYLSSGRLALLLEHKIISAEFHADSVRSLQARSIRSGDNVLLHGSYFIDATELGDLLPITKTEFVTGAESVRQTGELHAAEKEDPRNQQAFTVCLAVDHVPNEEHIIERPRDYDFWHDFVPKLQPPWPGKLLGLTYTHPPTGQARTLGFDPEGETPGRLNLWRYRRLIAKRNFDPGAFDGDISLINWPQNDYTLGNLVGVSESEQAGHIGRARQLSLSWLYWLQTEAPRADGRVGWAGLRLRGDLLGSGNGVAKYPYVRESRRIRAAFTILEQHIGRAARAQMTGQKEAEVRAQNFSDTVGIGSYSIDLHPSTAGNNYIDFQTVPFQIPLGALLPVRINNLLPACKNIGTTHVTNGCYRLHPVEWNIGEAAGLLVSFALRKTVPPKAVREKSDLLAEFQQWIRDQGVETHWPLS